VGWRQLSFEAEVLWSRWRFRGAGLRRRDLTDPALERRRIALPKAQDKAL
jgi:hypothetical protein